MGRGWAMVLGTSKDTMQQNAAHSRRRKRTELSVEIQDKKLVLATAYYYDTISKLSSLYVEELLSRRPKMHPTTNSLKGMRLFDIQTRTYIILVIKVKKPALRSLNTFMASRASFHHGIHMHIMASKVQRN